MLLGNALVDLFESLVNEFNASSALVLALLLIAAGVCLVLGARRRTSSRAQ